MAKKNTQKRAGSNASSDDSNLDPNNLDGGFAQDEPGHSPTPRSPSLVWNDAKIEAFAFVLRHPENESGDTLDEITARLAADPAFAADVETGALTSTKLQMRRNQLIKSGLIAPDIRRRKGQTGPRATFRPDIDKLNQL